MSYLSGRRVVVAVGDGVAACTATEIVRALRRLDARVRVLLTESAEHFVSPLTLRELSQHPVEGVGSEHVRHANPHELAQWAEVVVVAPATVRLMARLAAGVADDLLTSVVTAANVPILVCPALSEAETLETEAQQNLGLLTARASTSVLLADTQDRAWLEAGFRYLPDADSVAQLLGRVLGSGLLVGRRVVVTAGPTREAFDPVRFLSNRSSGKMGYALAAEAWRAGADVLLISGPVTLTPPFGVRLLQVTTAAQMKQAVFESVDDILVMAAAVADYTPRETLEHKRKKTDGDWNPVLGRTADILGELARHSVRPRLTIGFAAETDAVEEYAADKLRRKSLDGIVGNSVAGPGGAFENDHNTVVMLTHGRAAHHVGPATKREIAESIVQWISTLPSGVSHG